MTRARFKLYITFWGNKGSRFIADMDPELYRLTGEKPNIKVPVFVPKNTASSSSEDGSIVVRNASKQEESSVRAASGTITKDTNSKQTGAESELVTFLKSKGIEVIDKRDKGGALWMVGDKSLDPIVQETKRKFGALWIFKAEGGMATERRPSWYTKSTK
jgi:hypothetical protein